MSSKNAPDLLDLERDIPTTPEDVRALQKNRPQPEGDWWDLLTKLAQQVPNLKELRRRRPTFAGCEPFEL